MDGENGIFHYFLFFWFLFFLKILSNMNSKEVLISALLFLRVKFFLISRCVAMYLVNTGNLSLKTKILFLFDGH